jgi:tellurite methyltransferase
VSPTTDASSSPDIAVPRRILGFERDASDAWIARLDCGHRRHVRHRPPLSDYPWIADADGRAARIGAAIECERCRRCELPDGAAPYRTTDEFDEATLPAGLRRDHATRPGVWARVEVLAGRLRFVMPALAVDRVLAADEHVIIPPELPHHVEPLGPVRLRIVFLRANAADAAPRE